MMRIIDLFAGCGGMSKGFQNAGFQLCAACDNWQPAIEVYGKNFLTHPILFSDLTSYQNNITLFSNFNPDMIIGGPPCQDFSSAGKRDETLGRANLTICFANIVSAVKPKWFVMENVDRIISSQAYQEAYHILAENSYGLTEMILDASYCGVPQSRKRLFLIGELGGVKNSLLPYLQRNLSAKPMTIRDYFGSSLGINYYYRHPRSYMRRGIFSIDEPSPTIRGVNRPIPPTYRNHPGDSVPVTADLRPLTTKERSLIQTFPTDFIFEGTKSDLEQLIGNAVPVKLAEYVANCINDYISDFSKGLSHKTEELTQLAFQFS